MASSARVRNVTAKNEVKVGQARRWVASGVFAWVEEGVSIRRLTMAEMVEERGRLSRESESVVPFDVRGIVVVGIADIQRERKLARIATCFAWPCKPKVRR